MSGKSVVSVEDVSGQPEDAELSLRFGDVEEEGSGDVLVYLCDIDELFRGEVDQYSCQVDEDAVDLLAVATLHHGVYFQDSPVEEFEVGDKQPHDLLIG